MKSINVKNKSELNELIKQYGELTCCKDYLIDYAEEFKTLLPDDDKVEPGMYISVGRGVAVHEIYADEDVAYKCHC